MIETVVLTIATAGLVLYAVVAALAFWAERPVIGREPDGTPRVARPEPRR